VNLDYHDSWGNALTIFLEHAENVIMARADLDRRIVGCNLALMRLLRKSDRPLGMKLEEIFRYPDGTEAVFASPQSGASPLPQILKLRGGEDLYKVISRLEGEEWTVLAERIGGGDGMVMQAMSTLTNDLVNIGRDLARRNRELAETRERLEKISRTDFLTGLANRGYFMERFQEAVFAADQQGEPLSLLMADLDHFKKVNDTFGHNAGDEVLKACAATLLRICRSEDLAARSGGEEFLIFLPNTTAEDAQRVALRICAFMRETDVLGNGIPVTVSIGVAGHIRGESPDDFLKRVDQALYRAKEKGRNRISL
jgi:diguanylate cyclase (GGDEF)-like protein